MNSISRANAAAAIELWMRSTRMLHDYQDINFELPDQIPMVITRQKPQVREIKKEGMVLLRINGKKA